MWSLNGFSRTSFSTAYVQDGKCIHLKGMCGAKSCHQWRKREHQSWEIQSYASLGYCVHILGLLYYRQKLQKNMLAFWAAEANICLSHCTSWVLLLMEARNTELFPRVKNSRGKALYIASFRDLLQNMAVLSSCQSPSDKAKVSKIHLNRPDFQKCWATSSPTGNMATQNLHKMKSQMPAHKAQVKKYPAIASNSSPLGLPWCLLPLQLQALPQHLSDRKSKLPWGNSILPYWHYPFIEFYIRYFEIFTSLVRYYCIFLTKQCWK